MSNVTAPSKWARHERRKVTNLEAAIGPTDATRQMLDLIGTVEQSYGQFVELRADVRSQALGVGIPEDRWHGHIYTETPSPAPAEAPVKVKPTRRAGRNWHRQAVA